MVKALIDSHSFVRRCLAALVCLPLCFMPVYSAAKRQSIYIGTYTDSGSRGIYRTTLDLATGVLSAPELVAETKSPSFLALQSNGHFLFAANESSDRVSAFSILPNGGKLKLLNDAPTGGSGPCHLAIDLSGKLLVVANYGGGSIAAFPIGNNGQIGPRSQLIQLRRLRSR